MIFFCDLSILPLISYFVLKKIFFLSDMIEFENNLLNFPSFLSNSFQPKKIFCAFCVQINNILKFCYWYTKVFKLSLWDSWRHSKIYFCLWEESNENFWKIIKKIDIFKKYINCALCVRIMVRNFFEAQLMYISILVLTYMLIVFLVFSKCLLKVNRVKIHRYDFHL